MNKKSILKSYYNDYIRDISIVFLLLLPLIICNAITLFVGYTLKWVDFSELADHFFYFSNLNFKDTSLLPFIKIIILT